MNNKELETKIKELLNESNLLDLIEHAYEFNKEYKTSSFYKNTKMDLFTLLKYAKVFYVFSLDDFFAKVQEKINTLDFSSVNGILNTMSENFNSESNDVMTILKEMKEIL